MTYSEEESRRGQANLKIADQMWKDAFLVKKTRFASENPGLTDEELTKMTAAYFPKMSESKSKW